MTDNIRTIIFAVVLGIVCSLVLATVSRFTTPYREANEKAEKVRNFLSALGVPVDPRSDSKTLLAIFDKNVVVREIGNLTLYEYVPETSDSGKVVAYAVPFAGSGVWGPIRGVLALEPDLYTIRGIRFYQQEETPGLGGEIGSDWFLEQFPGKKIVSRTGEPGFRILKPGTAADENSVDAITGATMTSDRVQTILDRLAIQLRQALNDEP